LSHEIKKILENSYEMSRQDFDCKNMSRLEYLSDYIFDFTTYDGEMSELFAQKAVEVCSVITDGKTFKYIENEENYKWYLIMCNMPFFYANLDWGTSIRGAWWDHKDEFRLDSCGLYRGEKQIVEPMKFNRHEWCEFIKEVCAFSKLRVSGDES